MTCMSWDDAQAYVAWLSRTTEVPYRLPTPDELTAAAAEDSQPWCSQWRTAPPRPGTCPVGTYGRNRFGLSDLLANVSEWTSRCARGDCGRRWRYGGNWDVYSNLLVPHAGSYRPTDSRAATGGFRVARILE